MPNDDFVGAEEVLRMEHGAAYGMSRIQYWRLASCALACEKYAEIQPSTISALVHEPGCQRELFGKRCLFTITVHPRRQTTAPAHSTPCHYHERGWARGACD